MRSAADVILVLRLYEEGFNKCDISRRTGVSLNTVKRWTAGQMLNLEARTPRAGCFHCEPSRGSADFAAYAYLLGMYLGDGHLVPLPRAVWRLAITQDARYTNLIRRCCEAIIRVGARQPTLRRRTGCFDITSWWKHWIHLFPQHGPGPKHTRPILLEPWQRVIVTAQPREFLAGLIHSDGSRSLNTIRRINRTGAIVSYAYPRYLFANTSLDIHRLFSDTCDVLGVHWTRISAKNLAVSRRGDVAFIDTFIGAKS